MKPRLCRGKRRVTVSHRIHVKFWSGLHCAAPPGKLSQPTSQRHICRATAGFSGHFFSGFQKRCVWKMKQIHGGGVGDVRDRLGLSKERY